MTVNNEQTNLSSQFDEYSSWNKTYIFDKYKTLSRENYESDEAYRAALIDQYKLIRNEEYQAVCYNAGIEMYHDSRCVNITTRNTDAMDIHIWNGCQNIGEHIIPGDSIARRTPEHVMYQYSKSDKNACCAITGSTVVQKICADMNCKGGANIVQFDGVPGKIIDHKIFDYWHTGAGNFTFDPNSRDYTGKSKVILKKAITEGQIGPGDRIAFPSSLSRSGYHERTLISVNKNEKGEIIGYTIQANNLTEFSYHDINDPKDRYNNSSVLYASTNKWMNEQIATECKDMENMSVEEIQSKIDQSKNNIMNKRTSSIQMEHDLLFDSRYTNNSIDSQTQNKSFRNHFNKSQLQSFLTSPYRYREPTDLLQADITSAHVEPLQNPGDIRLVQQNQANSETTDPDAQIKTENTENTDKDALLNQMIDDCNAATIVMHQLDIQLNQPTPNKEQQSEKAQETDLIRMQQYNNGGR